VKAILGVANHNVGYVEQFLHPHSKSKGYKFGVVGFGQKFPKSKDVVCVLSLHELKKNLKFLNKKSNQQVVILFDAPVHLEYVKNLKMLDVKPKKRSFCYSFMPLSKPDLTHSVSQALNSSDTLKISIEDLKVVPTLLNETLPSILNPIQTFLYRIKNPEKRLEYQKLIYVWMVSRETVDDLMARLKVERKTQGIRDFEEALRSKECSKTRKAVRAALEAQLPTENDADDKKTKKANKSYQKLAQKYGLDIFDVKYCIQAIRRFTQTHKVLNKTVDQLLRDDPTLHTNERRKNKERNKK
jgi:hypothetical protein